MGKWACTLNRNLNCFFIIFLSILFISACSNKDSTETTADSSSETDEETNEVTDDETEAGDTDSPTTEEQAQSDVSDQQSSENNATNGASTLDDIPPIPTDEQALATQSPGPLAEVKNIYEKEKEIEEVFADVGAMSENPSDDEYELYLRKMYWLVAESYPNPEDTIKKWEFASFGDPDLPDERFHFKENYNIEVLLDASGSMGAEIEGKTMMEIAKESINDFLSEAPEEANVSFRVYGHKGSGSESDKDKSCSAIEQVYGYKPYDEKAFQKELDKIEPAGWTPLADALLEAENALKEYDSKNNTNLIYVVSDGVETCDGDPLKVAKSLADSNAKPIINIIGFNVDDNAHKQLEEMAEVSGGIFSEANDQKQMKEEFERAEEVMDAWKKWKKDAKSDIDAIRVDNSFDIMGLHNDWSFTTLGTDNNIWKMGYVLKDLEILTHDQLSEINKRRNGIFEDIDETVDELEKKLEKISADNIEEMKESVNDKYDAETGD